MKQKRLWKQPQKEQTETNAQKIISYLAEHPMENIGYSKIARELNIPFSSVRFIITTGKAEEIALKYGYMAKTFKKKPNVMEVRYMGINYSIENEKIEKKAHE